MLLPSPLVGSVREGLGVRGHAPRSTHHAPHATGPGSAPRACTGGEGEEVASSQAGVGAFGPRAARNSVPGRQGAPSAGSSTRSSPHQPATFQASTRNTPSPNSTGLVLAVPASMKLKFSSVPKKAAIPTKAPRISPSPISVSPTATSGANQGYHSCSSMKLRKSRYQP